MAVEAVLQPAPERARQIFVHCQSIDITETPTIQVASRRMVQSVSASPEIIRRQRERADETTDPVIRLTVGKEGAMATVVLDHKQANEKTCGWNRNEQRGPGITQRESEPRCHPQDHQRHKRNRQLGDAAHLTWLAIIGKNLRQGARICRANARIMSEAQDYFRNRPGGRIAVFFLARRRTVVAGASTLSFARRRARSRIILA